MHHINHTSRRSLTPLYCLHQAAYFFSMAGISAFAVTYLMTRGFGAAQIGVMLAMTNILSCILQPVIGSHVDRTSVSLLQKIIPAFLIAAFLALFCVELLRLPLAVTGLLYIAGYLSFSITLPLFNPLCAHYAKNGWHINYGAGNGTGSLSFSFASLGFGYIIAGLGTRAMMLVVMFFIWVQLLIVLRYPKVADAAPASGAHSVQSLSVSAFACRYRFFMATMIGVMCLAACHAMAENYLIQIFERIGGGSENVGVALFLACITAAPFMIFFERIQKKTGVIILLRLCGVFYIVKAALLVAAPSIVSVYLIELLQTCTYAFLYPSLYYLVVQRISSEDMAKGQTLASSIFTLGMALGNSLGGVAIERLGLSVMLIIAACIAIAGTLLINAVISRPDIAPGTQTP